MESQEPHSTRISPDSGKEVDIHESASGDMSVERRPRFGLWAVLNMASVVFCAALPTGIPGFVMALLAQIDWQGGDASGARRKYKLAVLLGSLSLIWGGLIAIGVVTFLIVAALAPGSNSPLAPPSY